jgi:hypothetical protein
VRLLQGVGRSFRRCGSSSGDSGTTDAGTTDAHAPDGGDPCERTSIRKLDPPAIAYLSPDGQRTLISRPDDAGTYQVYVGDATSPLDLSQATCISCTQQRGGPKPSDRKFMIGWHPSGDWIFAGGEIDAAPLAPTPQLEIEFLSAGIDLNMYIAKPDGSIWYQLTNYDPSSGAAGYTGPAVTPDGGRAYWASYAGSNFPMYTFGQWRLMSADLQMPATGTHARQRRRHDTSRREPRGTGQHFSGR